MGTLRNADWYDHIFRVTPAYSRSAAEAPWRDVWQWVASHVTDTDRVLDLGCGPGHLAEILSARRGGSYVGIDFSRVAIDMARLRAPSAGFVLGDITTEMGPLIDDGIDVIVSTECMEHVADDLTIISQIPSGMRVVATVPSFDDPSHVRFFLSAADVQCRYSSVLSNVSVATIGPRFGFQGWRR